MDFSFTVDIDRPRPEVFAFLSRPENDLEWDERVVSVSRTGPMQEGARWTRTVRTPGGQSENVEECTVYQPSTRFAYRSVSGKARVEATYTLEPLDDGTRLTYAGTMRFTGLRRLLAPFVRGRVRSEIGESVERLADVLEAGKRVRVTA